MTEDFSSDAIYDKAAPVAAPQSLRFTPDKAQSKRNVADYLARVTKVDPAYAPQLAAELADGKVFDQYRQIMTGLGLESNDVADHFAVWWITAWEASTSGAVETPATAFANVSSQVSRILANESFGSLSGTQKQAFADSLMLQSLVLANQIEQAKADPAVAKKLSSSIKTAAKKLGLDLGAMTLTEDGFVPAKPRKRSDASDAADAEEKALASATPADPSAKGSPNYALIAGAAGAGLGLAFLIGKTMGRKELRCARNYGGITVTRAITP
jgi:hypothetical protein